MLSGSSPLDKFSNRISSTRNLVQPRPQRMIPPPPSSVEYPTEMIPSMGTTPLQQFSSFNSSEDEFNRQLMSSSLPNNKNILSIRRQEHQAHRRSMSNQTISIRNEGHGNEIVLKASMSDQNLIFQNENYSDGRNQFNQSMFITRHDPEGSSSNIVVSNETFGTGPTRFNSTCIQTGANVDDGNSMICLKNAMNTATSNSGGSGDDGVGPPNVNYRRSRNAMLPKIPTVAAAAAMQNNHRECVFDNGRRTTPRVESTASLDGFQGGGQVIGYGSPIGSGHQRKYVNERLLPRSPSLMCPSPSHAVGGVDNLSRKSVTTPAANRKLPSCEHLMTRSMGPIGAEQPQPLPLPQLEYDSDTGWKRRSMPINMFSSMAFEEPITAESWPISKVSTAAEATEKASRNLIESMPRESFLSATQYRGDGVGVCTSDGSITPTYIDNAQLSSSAQGPNVSIKKSNEAGGRRRKSQSGRDTADPDPTKADLNFAEFVGKDKGNAKMSRSASRLTKTKTDGGSVATEKHSKEAYDSSGSIKDIIDEVRTELLAKPKTNAYLSDESPPRDLSKNRRQIDKLPKTRANSRDKSHGRNNNAKRKKEEDMEKFKDNAEDTGDESDDVFTTPFLRGRNASFSAKEKKVARPKRRTSSLEDLITFQKKINQKNRNRSADGADSSRKTSSSVSINDTPQVFTYDKSSDSFKTLRGIARRSPTNSTSSLNNGVALLNSKPARGSLKKSPATASTSPSAGKPSSKSPAKKPDTKLPKKSAKPAAKSTKSSSEYEPRERRRDGNGNERDMYRYRDRDRDRDRGDRDRGDRDKELSDRDQRGSQNDSFNRSLSNTEGTPDDKIGEWSEVEDMRTSFSLLFLQMEA